MAEFLGADIWAYNSKYEAGSISAWQIGFGRSGFDSRCVHMSLPPTAVNKVVVMHLIFERSTTSGLTDFLHLLLATLAILLGISMFLFECEPMEA
jgi:hypothetical protein